MCVFFNKQNTTPLDKPIAIVAKAVSSFYGKPIYPERLKQDNSSRMEYNTFKYIACFLIQKYLNPSYQSISQYIWGHRNHSYSYRAIKKVKESAFTERAMYDTILAMCEDDFVAEIKKSYSGICSENVEMYINERDLQMNRVRRQASEAITHCCKIISQQDNLEGWVKSKLILSLEAQLTNIYQCQ